MQRWCFEMPTPVSSREMRAWIEESLSQRPDIGLVKGIISMFFDPPNPFDPRTRRKPKAGFILGAVLFVVASGCFCYFNLSR